LDSRHKYVGPAASFGKLRARPKSASFSLEAQQEAEFLLDRRLHDRSEATVAAVWSRVL